MPSHRKTPATIAALALLATLSACADSASGTADGPITLDFETLVWQPGAVAANQEIVDAWNAANPDVQVNLIRGSWSGMSDKLTTSFEANDAPDIFHYDSKRICDLFEQGHILNLEPYIPDEQIDDITDGSWKGVQRDGTDGICAIPFLHEADVIYANTTMLEDAGIEPPTMEDPWTWDDYRDVAKQLTVDADNNGTPEVYGAGVPLAAPTMRIMRLSFGSSGYFYEGEDTSNVTMTFGDAEKIVPTTLHDMMYTDKTVSTGDVGLATEDMLTNFFAGKTATFLGESWVRDQIVANAPDDLQWSLLPPIYGTSFAQPGSAQALGASANTDHPAEAAEFISFYTNPENQVKMALGDALIPTSSQAMTAPELTTTDFGWNIVTALGEHLEAAPFLESAGYNEWAQRVADPAFDRYFRNDITLDELGDILVNDGQTIMDRYNK